MGDLAAELGTDAVDVVPLSGAAPDLVDEIRRHGVLLVGSVESFETRSPAGAERADRDDALAALDELIADLDGVV